LTSYKKESAYLKTKPPHNQNTGRGDFKENHPHKETKNSYHLISTKNWFADQADLQCLPSSIRCFESIEKGNKMKSN